MCVPRHEQVRCDRTFPLMTDTQTEVLRVDDDVGVGAAKDELIRRLEIQHAVRCHVIINSGYYWDASRAVTCTMNRVR